MRILFRKFLQVLEVSMPLNKYILNKHDVVYMTGLLASRVKAPNDLPNLNECEDELLNAEQELEKACGGSPMRYVEDKVLESTLMPFFGSRQEAGAVMKANLDLGMARFKLTLCRLLNICLLPTDETIANAKLDEGFAEKRSYDHADILKALSTRYLSCPDVEQREDETVYKTRLGNHIQSFIGHLAKGNFAIQDNAPSALRLKIDMQSNIYYRLGAFHLSNIGDHFCAQAYELDHPKRSHQPVVPG